MTTGEQRIQVAERLGWRVYDANSVRMRFQHHEVHDGYIEVWADGSWCHVKTFPNGGERCIWDSGATRVIPKQFPAYLKRLVREAIKHDLRSRIRSTDDRKLPYPWCIGNPTTEDCYRAGYCGRNPNCGE